MVSGIISTAQGLSRFLTAELKRDKQCRTPALFAAVFAFLACISFLTSFWSESLVLRLNAFILVHRGFLHGANLASRVTASPSCTSFAEANGYTFGLARLEVLLQYVSVVFLFFGCLTTTMESIRHMFEPHDVHPISVELLCLAHMGAIILSTKPEVWARAKRRGKQALSQRIVTECFPPIMCFLSVQLVSWTGNCRVDVFVALLLTCVAAIKAVELFKQTAPILLQKSPTALKSVFDRALREVAVIEGVLEVRHAEYWTLVDGHVVASLKLRLSVSANDAAVQRSVETLMAPLVSDLTVDLLHGWDPSPTGGQDAVPTFPLPPFLSHNHHQGHSHSHSCHGHSHDHGHDHGHDHNGACDHHTSTPSPVSPSASAPPVYPREATPPLVPMGAPPPPPPPPLVFPTAPTLLHRSGHQTKSPPPPLPPPVPQGPPAPGGFLPPVRRPYEP